MKHLALWLVTFALVGIAHADLKSERAAIGDALGKLSTSAATLATTAKSSDDRGARKKFAPAATELADDLAALARRIGKDVPLKAIAGDVADSDKATARLVELADEVDDKDARKSLRAEASLVQQSFAALRKQIDAVVAKESAGAGSSAPQRYTGRLFNTSNACSWEDNLKFAISREGQQVFASQMVFPGKDLGVVLERGRYAVQVLDTSGQLMAQGTLDADHEGWRFKSGCVNQK